MNKTDGDTEKNSQKAHNSDTPAGKSSKNKYIPVDIESKWQAEWEKEGIYQPDLNNAKRPFYNLMMFPYPSAEGLHVGSVYAFGGADIYARFKRMQGFDVFEPIGLDGFGIHSENHAIKTNTHPIEHAKRTEDNFYRQLHTIGNSFAWENKVETYDPDYYRWTQWLFIEIFKAGLAYKKKSPVNFCPSCKTVLADEQVIEGKCERCGTVVEKRDLEQWFFRISNYAERLLQNIEKLNWSDKVKVAQRNWIGKKVGINITYSVENSDQTVTVFTTRPDTNFGATFVVIAPENPLVKELTTKEHETEVNKYIEQALNKSEIERQAEGREKTGVFTGSYAINQLTGYKMPIWVSDYVLMGFGTGIVVGVPGHDKRDFEFASKFGLEVIRVVVAKDGDASPITKIEQVSEEDGTMINSEFLNGLDIHIATEKIMDFMEEKGYGKREVNYHLRDWLISRQRYWGPPIPMIYCSTCAEKGKSWFSSDEATEYKVLRSKNKEKNNENILNTKYLILNTEMAGWFPAPEGDLPVKLPYVEDFKPMGTGKSPLANYPEFYETVCPGCGAAARRETDVSDTFLDSAWYFLRYLATDQNDIPFPSEKLKAQNEKLNERSRFLPVTMYIGGAEHSVLHLLYSRFVTMVVYDLGYISFEEPFSRFYAHGLIIKDGAKMSKSKGNVINPDEYIKKYGADTLRTYLLFLGPFNMGGDFKDTGIEGMYRFLKRVWALFETHVVNGSQSAEPRKTKTQNNAVDSVVSREVPFSSAALKEMHKTIKGVTEDLEELRYNTVIAKLMTWYNFLSHSASSGQAISKGEASAYLQMLAPFAPHMTEELWVQLGNEFSIHKSKWPSYDSSFIKEDVVKIAVQVNGKLRGMLEIASDQIQDSKLIEKAAKDDDKVSKFIEGTIRKVIYVPGKVVNFVV